MCTLAGGCCLANVYRIGYRVRSSISFCCVDRKDQDKFPLKRGMQKCTSRVTYRRMTSPPWLFPARSSRATCQLRDASDLAETAHWR